MMIKMKYGRLLLMVTIEGKGRRRRVQGTMVRDAPPRSLFAPMRTEEKMVLLRGLAHGWSLDQLSKAAGVAPTTVVSFKKQLYLNPKLVARLPVSILVSKNRYRCAICGNIRPTLITATRHVLAHVLPIEVARSCNLEGLSSEVL